MTGNDIILFLHFFGLMVGAAGGLGSGIIMRRAVALGPEEAKTIRGLGPLLHNASIIGVALLWVTGLVMVWSVWGGIGNLPAPMFWIKFVFVVLLTALTLYVHMTYAEVKKGNMAAAARLARLGPASGICSLLSVFFAVLAFH